MRYDGSTICVTGGAGFIGSAVIRHLLDNTGASVGNIDKLTYASSLSSIPQGVRHPRYTFAQTDICDGTAIRHLFERHRPMAIMNLAAESHVDRSIEGPSEFIRTNIVGTFSLLQECLHYWRNLAPAEREQFRVLHVSTDEVYGSLGSDGRFTEATPTHRAPPIPPARHRRTISFVPGTRPTIFRSSSPTVQTITGLITSRKNSFRT